MLCERLDRIYRQAMISVHEEGDGQMGCGEGGARDITGGSVAIKLGLKKIRKKIYKFLQKKNLNFLFFS